MVVILLWTAFIIFLIYGAVLLSRLRAEDPRRWPDGGLRAGGARLRIHPAWTAREENGRLRIDTTTRDATLVVEPRPHGGGPSLSRAELARKLEEIVAESGVTPDDPTIEPFAVPAGPGARLLSAGTEPEGERRYVEFHLLGGPGGGLLFRYSCPVLLGSLDSRALARCIETVRMGAGETGGAGPQ